MITTLPGFFRSTLREDLAFVFMLPLVLLLTLAACDTPSTVAETPAQRVFAATSEYDAALELAVRYESLPRCAETVSKACSSPEVVDILRKADNTAKVALDTAQAVVRSSMFQGGEAGTSVVDSARAAVDAMKNILKQIGLL